MTPASIPQAGPADGALEASRRSARGVIAQVDQQAIAQLLEQLPTGALLKELDGILQTLDAADAVAARRRAGLLGRLLGRDLVAMARVDHIDTRLRLHLAGTDTHAASLKAHIALLASASEHLQGQIDALLEVTRLASCETGGDPQHEDVTRRWLSHLDALAVGWRSTAAQLAMAISYARSMLERHRQVRDVLIPLWRQRVSAKALSTKLGADEASSQRSLHESVRRQITALRRSHQPPPALSHPSTPTFKELPP